MANYKESVVAGTQWRRAVRVIVDNPLDSTPHVTFTEETVVQLGDSTLTKPEGTLQRVFSAASEFPLVNPETGDVLGVMNHQELYVALASLYLFEATQRDQQEEALEAPPEVL